MADSTTATALSIKVTPPEIALNGIVRLEATSSDPKFERNRKKLWFDWAVKHPVTKKNIGRIDVDDASPWIAHWNSTKADIGPQDVTLTTWMKRHPRARANDEAVTDAAGDPGGHPAAVRFRAIADRLSGQASRLFATATVRAACRRRRPEHQLVARTSG